MQVTQKTWRIGAMLLALALLLTSCGITPPGGASAATMHLKRTEGQVGVSDDAGKDVEPRDDLGLYSGYRVDTRSESYAWIDLDEVKLTKLDEDSQIAITKEDKALEIEVLSGSLFFNVTQPLAEDETMTIRSVTMAVGIRGTCGWVSLSEDGDALSVYLLEGKVRCEADGNSETIQAGEQAVMTADGDITVFKFTISDIPDFVSEEIENIQKLTDAIMENFGSEPDTGTAAPSSRALPVRWTHYGADDSFSGYAECAYDEQGVQTDTRYAWNWYTETLEYSGNSIFIYNEQGREQEIWHYTPEGELRSHYTLIESTEDHATYEDDSHKTYTDYYNEQGQMIRTEYISGGYSLYEYDAQGRRIREEVYLADGTYSAYTVFEYEP